MELGESLIFKFEKFVVKLILYWRKTGFNGKRTSDAVPSRKSFRVVSLIRKESALRQVPFLYKEHPHHTERNERHEGDAFFCSTFLEFVPDQCKQDADK